VRGCKGSGGFQPSSPEKCAKIVRRNTANLGLTTHVSHQAQYRYGYAARNHSDTFRFAPGGPDLSAAGKPRWRCVVAAAAARIGSLRDPRVAPTCGGAVPFADAFGEKLR